MTNPIIKIHDVANDKVTERPMNAAELKEYNLARGNSAVEQAEEEAKATAKAELLAKLGITAEEATLLLS
jgi:hypothetical protein